MKSVSKIRHIQESNLRLEKRYLMEQPQSGTTQQPYDMVKPGTKKNMPQPTRDGLVVFMSKHGFVEPTLEPKERTKINGIIESLVEDEDHAFNKELSIYFKRDKDNVKLITDGKYLYYLSAPVGKLAGKIYIFKDGFYNNPFH